MKSPKNTPPRRKLTGPLTPTDAANALGVSYPTVKQWIYRKKIRSVRTAGGHHRIPRSEIVRLGGAAPRSESNALAAISGRNKLAGFVARLRTSGLIAEVTIDIGGQSLTAIITSDSARQLDLRVGRPAIALIKATEVMVIGG
jgi:molybdopterin-binding protein